MQPSEGCTPPTAQRGLCGSAPRRGLCTKTNPQPGEGSVEKVYPGEGSTPVHPGEGSARTVHEACHGRECLGCPFGDPDTGHGERTRGGRPRLMVFVHRRWPECGGILLLHSQAVVAKGGHRTRGAVVPSSSGKHAHRAGFRSGTAQVWGACALRSMLSTPGARVCCLGRTCQCEGEIPCAGLLAAGEIR